jgi:tetratricopeptide (TPR) repeat protein
MATWFMATPRLDSLGMIVLLAAALAAPIPRMSHAAEVCAPVLARVVSLQGTVEFRSSETEPWTDAALNDLLCADYWIRVGPSSRAGLALPNDSVLRLDQQTTVRLRAQAEETRSLLELLLGTLYLFSHRPRALEIDTPFVNAATEGTEFLVSVGADQTRIIVFEGRILAQNPDGELLLASGDAAVAVAGAAPRAQIVAQPRDAVAWTLYYPPILTALAEREPAPRGLPPGLQTAVDRVAANDYPGALRALDTVRDAARDARYYTYRAGVLLNVGRVEEARDAIGRALALDPAAGEALAQRSIIALVQDRREEALADARRAVELSPDSAAVRIALSYAQQATFQLEAARATLREAVEVAPGDALAWARLSELELSFGELRAALGAADRAVALAPQLSRTQTVLGFADLARFDVGEAKTAFERAIALDSADPLPRLGLGLAMIRQSDLEQGRNEIEIAVALDPDNSLIRSYLGKAFFEEKRDGQAGEQYAIAKRLDPLDPTPWLYDAILKQTQGRPGEALEDVQRSIALNDNRAVFRSSLLLDEDLATSLASIYDDLGFLQPGIIEASRSLSFDPANTGAHRFLSDIYVGVRRREIARVSNLLQAQMLQDLNTNPVQPSLSEPNLNLVTQGGPAEAGFSEFAPLFERNEANLNLSGVAGNENTYGGEGVVSALYDRYSVSAGAFGYRSDGWRDNNDNKQNVQDVYFQTAITPELNAQAEFRRRHSDQGDLAFRFDPDDFLPNLRRNVDQSSYRGGLRYSPFPSSDFLASFAYGHLREELDFSFAKVRTKDRGPLTEAQHIYKKDWFNITSGFGYGDVNRRIGDSNKQQITEYGGYSYGNINVPAPVIWTVGVGYDRFEHNAAEVDKINPKLGIEWNATDNLLLRGTVFRVVKPALINNQTLEPTEVAGFNQLFDDFNGAASWRYGLGLDYDLRSNLFVGAQATWREISTPIVTSLDASSRVFEKTHEQTHSSYLHWLPIPQVALSVEFVYDKYSSEEGIFTTFGGFPERLVSYSVPFGVRYFHPSGFFAGAGATYVNQDVNRAEGFPDGQDDFFLVDTAVGYRFPKRFGIVSLSISNLFDKGFKYMDDSFREAATEPSVGPYIPERQILARLTLNW